MESETLRSQLEALHGESFGWALACCDRNPEMAHEVVQMAYVAALEGRAHWNGHASFRTFMFAVIRNTAADQRRRAWFRGTGLARFVRSRPEPPPARDPESSTAASEATRLLRAALERLSRRQREVLQLVFYHGLTIEEAAGILEVAPGTARLHYERGKRRLRELLPPEVIR